MKLNYEHLICAIAPSTIGAIALFLTANARQTDRNVSSATEQQLQVKVAYLAGQLAASRSIERIEHRRHSRTTPHMDTLSDKELTPIPEPEPDTMISTILAQADSVAQSDSSIKVQPTPFDKVRGAKAYRPNVSKDPTKRR